MVMPPTVLAFAALPAVAACGTVPRWDSLIWLPPRVSALSFLPAMELSLIDLPLIVPAAYAEPPIAMNKATVATMNAGDGRSRIAMAVLRPRRTAPAPSQDTDDP